MRAGDRQPSDVLNSTIHHEWARLSRAWLLGDKLRSNSFPGRYARRDD